MVHADDKKMKALHEALKAIREDPAAFKDNPKKKAPDLDDDAAAVFAAMSDAELQCVLETDEAMKKAGFTIGSGDLSVRMV
ncbi:MAG: hypothetical protein V7645_1546 [Actinomycetota bacterium]